MERAQHRDIKRRQKSVLASLGSDVLILATDAGASAGFGNGGDGNSFYMAGFPESRAVVVLDPTQSRESVALFVKAKIRHEEVWEGFAIGVQASVLRSSRRGFSEWLMVHSTRRLSRTPSRYTVKSSSKVLAQWWSGYLVSSASCHFWKVWMAPIICTRWSIP